MKGHLGSNADFTYYKVNALLSGATQILYLLLFLNVSIKMNTFFKERSTLHVVHIFSTLKWWLSKNCNKDSKSGNKNFKRLMSESKCFKHVLSILCLVCVPSWTCVHKWSISFHYIDAEPIITWFSSLIMSLGLWDDQTIPLWLHYNTTLKTKTKHWALDFTPGKDSHITNQVEQDKDSL